MANDDDARIADLIANWATRGRGTCSAACSSEPCRT